MENKVKHRSARCTAEQYDCMINFICDNRIMIKGKTSQEESKEAEKKWVELLEILNNMKGAKKSLQQWKRVRLFTSFTFIYIKN